MTDPAEVLAQQITDRVVVFTLGLAAISYGAQIVTGHSVHSRVSHFCGLTVSRREG
jgi:hypothetical protein